MAPTTVDAADAPAGGEEPPPAAGRKRPAPEDEEVDDESPEGDEDEASAIVPAIPKWHAPGGDAEEAAAVEDGGGDAEKAGQETDGATASRPSAEAVAAQAAAREAAAAVSTETRIHSFLESRRTYPGLPGFRYPPSHPNFALASAPRKLCSGVCGMARTKDEFSVTQWNRGAGKTRLCLLCTKLTPPKKRPRRNKKDLNEQSSFKFGTVEIDEDDCIIAKKPAPRKIEGTDEEGLPPEMQRSRNGDTPYGRIRACMCATPGVCRDIMWRWARLKKGEYINYLNLPHSFKTDTPVAKHVSAFREATLRHMGYGITDGRTVLRKVKNRPNETMSHQLIKGERVSILHYHPEVIPYVLQEKGAKMGKVHRFRIPKDLGDKLGMGEEDLCPTPDINGFQSYFAVPNYSLRQAKKDIEKAEAEYRQKFFEIKEKNEIMASEMPVNPGKYIMEMHELKQENAALKNENDDLKKKLKDEKKTQGEMEKRADRLQRGLEKIARRMDRWESSKRIARNADYNAKVIYKEATGKDLADDGYFTVEPAGKPTKPRAKKSRKKGKGGKRWSDPRMDQAVEAKWMDPTLSTEEALLMGGYEFPMLHQVGVPQKDVVDADGVNLTQRKNNLLRRLRTKKKQLEKMNEKARAEEGEGEDESEEERYEDAGEIEEATVDDLV